MRPHPPQQLGAHRRRDGEIGRRHRARRLERQRVVGQRVAELRNLLAQARAKRRVAGEMAATRGSNDVRRDAAAAEHRAPRVGLEARPLRRGRYRAAVAGSSSVVRLRLMLRPDGVNHSAVVSFTAP